MTLNSCIFVSVKMLLLLLLLVIITFLSHLRNSASLQVSGCEVVFADSDFESKDAAGNIS